MRSAGFNIRGTIFIRSLQFLGFVDDIDIIGRNTRIRGIVWRKNPEVEMAFATHEVCYIPHADRTGRFLRA